jgi:uroporphyrinogen decarboxylase
VVREEDCQMAAVSSIGSYPAKRVASLSERFVSSMESRERVLAALDHREGDRVPLDLGGTVVTGIHRQAYAALRRYLGLPSTKVLLGDIVQQLALIDEDVAAIVKSDVRGAGPGSVPALQPEIGIRAGYRTFTDMWGIGWRMPVDSSLYFDMYQHPLSEAEVVEDIDSHPWPDVSGFQFDRIRWQCQQMRAQGKAVVLGMLCGGVAEMAAALRGYVNFYMDLVSNPVLAEHLMDKILELKMVYWQHAIAAAGEYIDVVAEGEDLGSQDRLLVSPQTYRRYIKPRHTLLFSFVKQRAPVRIFLHSCGAIRPIIADLIESGIDILNPVQKSAAGMDLVELKQVFGKDVVFWGGGVSTQRILSQGSPQAVRDDVRRSIDALAPGGGFVFSADHNIQADVPPENVVTMLETLRDYGEYT